MDLRQKIVEELHKKARKNFPRRQTVLKGLKDNYYQADLIVGMPNAKQNKGFHYILLMINCFSKMVFAVPLKSKSSTEMYKAMKKLLQETTVRLLQTDDGKEFFNSQFNNLMKLCNIKHYSTFSDKKAAIVERVIRTIKSMLYKQMFNRGSNVWYDLLPKIILEYNSKKHRSIGMSPLEVNKSNEKLVLRNLKRSTYPKIEKHQLQNPMKFNIGDIVRVSKYKHIFTKGYRPNWTNETFVVHRVQPTVPETYILKDKDNNVLQGGFYGHELSLSKVGDVYLVEKILKQKGDKYLVRWFGFDTKADSWISKKDLI